MQDTPTVSIIPTSSIRLSKIDKESVTMEITGGKWYLEEETGLILSIPEGMDSPVSVASVGGSEEPLTRKHLGETIANGERIVLAVNSYDAMLERLKATNEELPFIRDRSGFTPGSIAVQVIDSVITKNAEAIALTSGRDCEDVLEYSEADESAAAESVTRFMLEELNNTLNP